MVVDEIVVENVVGVEGVVVGRVVAGAPIVGEVGVVGAAVVLVREALLLFLARLRHLPYRCHIGMGRYLVERLSSGGRGEVVGGVKVDVEAGGETGVGHFGMARFGFEIGEVWVVAVVGVVGGAASMLSLAWLHCLL